ncbi:transient receptor potential cation channel subfamily M member-like 2 [Babylonia areolata]|uniref:transient receptor potential cation channel subfamily M member-like 2 n=1 Tax=Babylonia areolata TaxID=304850 RepID=UPI003FD68DCC
MMSGDPGQTAFLPGIQKPPHHSQEHSSQRGRSQTPRARPLTRQLSTQWKFDMSGNAATPQAVPSPSLDSAKLPEKLNESSDDILQKKAVGQSSLQDGQTPEHLQKPRNKERKKGKKSHREAMGKGRKAKSLEFILGHSYPGFQKDDDDANQQQDPVPGSLKDDGSYSLAESRESSVKTRSILRMKSSAGKASSGMKIEKRSESSVSFSSGKSRYWLTGSRKPSAIPAVTRRNLNQKYTATYIFTNIKQRKCSVYVKDNDSDTHKCQCGREAQWHRDRGLDISMETSNVLWDPSRHTRRLPCDSFGEVLFRGFGIQSDRTSPYMRVDSECEMENVWTVLMNCWQLPVPKLLISITGGAKRFNLRPRLKTILKQGLVNAAVTTGAWIITGGTATGVMEFVGEAVQDHVHSSSSSEENQCVALGVASWGIIANNMALNGHGNQGLFPASYCMEDIKVEGKKSALLDHNHTHFLLVDDGSEGHFGVEIEFRSRLQSYISQKVETGVTESQSINVPSVLIVVEGGINTMKTVRESITGKMPVVVIKGSGRAADFIATAFQLTKSVNDEDQSVYPMDFEETMFAKAKVMFEWKTDMAEEDIDRSIYETLHYLECCLEERKLLTIFNLDKAESEKDIDRAILYALLRANKSDANSQLALALAWNRCDIARQEIFTSKNRHVWQQADLYNAMFTALVQNRSDFVQLFLDNGVDLKLFLTTRTLWNLYCNCIVDPADAEAGLLRYLISRLKQTLAAFLLCRGTPEFESFPDLLPCVNRLIVHLLQDKRFCFYTAEDHTVVGESPTMTWKGDLQSVQPRRARLLSHQFPPDQGLLALGNSMTKSSMEVVDFEYPERELFIWAVLFNRRELSHLFWRSGKDHLGGALFASALLYRMSLQADKEEEAELCVDMAAHSDECERWALGVLSECYRRDKQLTHCLLVRDLEHWGHTTLFSLAESHKLMEFTEHSACQTKMTSIWKGRIALYTSERKIFLCTFLPVFIPFIKFTVDPKNLEQKGSLLEEEEEELTTGSPRVSAGRPVPMGNRVGPQPLPDADGDGLGFVESTARRDTRILAARLKKVNLFDFTTDNLSIWSAVYFFYEAPVTKFFSNLLAYLVFMSLFTYVVLVKLAPVDEEDSPSIEEYLTWGWCFTLVMEEIRQIGAREQSSFKYKFRNWFWNFWNCFDGLIYLLFLLSIVLRYTLTGDDFVGARVTYSVTLALFFLRSMQYFHVEKNMGPKIIMIHRMLKDLLFFFLILLVFMVSFGAAYHANLYPQSPASLAILVNILFYPYFQMYGDLFLAEMKGEDIDGCTHNETIWRQDILKRCPSKNAVVPMLLAVYMIITHVLLINLLIAMFSYTFQRVQDNSTQVWRFNRLSLLSEYCDRPALFPPLLILAHAWRFLCWVWRRATGRNHSQNALRRKLTEPEQMRLTLFEKNAVDTHLSLSRQSSKVSLDHRVTNTAIRLDAVMEELERIKKYLRPSDNIRTSLALPQQFDPNRQVSDDPATRLQREREMMDRSLLTGTPLSTQRSKSQPKNAEELNRKVDGVIAQTAAMSQHLSHLTLLLETSLASQRRSGTGGHDKA